MFYLKTNKKLASPVQRAKRTPKKRPSKKHITTITNEKRCQFHLQQNAQAYITKKNLKASVANDIRTIFNAPDRQEAERLLNSM